jgi:uncharacterized protein (DUF427 family)
MSAIAFVEPSTSLGQDDARAVVQAVWAGTVLAASSRTLQMDGVVYFPPEDVRQEYLTESGTSRVSLAYGQACLLDVTVAGRTDPSAAWRWPPPSPLARHLPGHVAFGGEAVIVRQEAPLD